MGSASCSGSGKDSSGSPCDGTCTKFTWQNRELDMTTSILVESDIDNPACAASGNNRAFQLPIPVLDAACDGTLVLFAGAGISTESKLAFPVSFYDEIRSKLQINDRPEFKVVMDEYCRQPNGRALLLNEIRQRFLKAKLWPEINRAVTRFHRVVATIPHLTDIITTNWDDFFELVCNAVPLVSGEDFIFWNTAGRKVYKIHGSVNSYGSLVATSDDFKRRYAELKNGLVGDSLRMMLATRTILFVGYSLRDIEFVRMYKLLTKDMSGMIPHAYIITLTDESATRFSEMGMTPIVTDATFFIKSLRAQMVQRGVLLDESRFEGVALKGEQLTAKHRDLANIDKNLAPAIYYTAMYQDGVLSSLEHILAAWVTGTFYDPHRIHQLIQMVNESILEAKRSGRYSDEAYLKGKLDAFLFVIFSDEDRRYSPNYFVFGIDEAILTEEAFVEDAKRAAELHPKAYELAVKIIEEHGGDATEIHHTPHPYC